MSTGTDFPDRVLAYENRPSGRQTFTTATFQDLGVVGDPLIVAVYELKRVVKLEARVVVDVTPYEETARIPDGAPRRVALDLDDLIDGEGS